jgi:hypothetical protein
MASLPARVAGDILAALLDPLWPKDNLKLRLYTGSRQITSAVVITEQPEMTRWIPVTEGQKYEYQYNGAAPVMIRYLDLYFGDGERFLREAVNKVMADGQTFSFIIPVLSHQTVSTG